MFRVKFPFSLETVDFNGTITVTLQHVLHAMDVVQVSAMPYDFINLVDEYVFVVFMRFLNRRIKVQIPSLRFINPH